MAVVGLKDLQLSHGLKRSGGQTRDRSDNLLKKQFEHITISFKLATRRLAEKSVVKFGHKKENCFVFQHSKELTSEFARGDHAHEGSSDGPTHISIRRRADRYQP